jgi:hypothetical protein
MVSLQEWMVVALLSFHTTAIMSPLVLIQREVGISAKYLVEMFPSPTYETVTLLLVSNTKMFYDPNIPFHLLNKRIN